MKLPEDHPKYPGQLFSECIRPGAFLKSIAGQDIRALINHDPSRVLGRNMAGTLRLLEDDVGLYAEIDPPETSFAADLIVSLSRGDISGMSFRFYATKDEWTDSDYGLKRELVELEIDEVSIVTFPAYPDTEVAVRSLDKHLSKQPTGPVRPTWFPRRNRARLALVDL